MEGSPCDPKFLK